MTALYFEELNMSIEKVERASSTYEHWEAAIVEMRKRYGFLLYYNDLCDEENRMVDLITEFDRYQT